MIKRYRNYESLFKGTLENLSAGSLIVSTPQLQTLQYHGSKPGPCADMIIKDWRVIKDFIKQGELGILRAYQAGLVETTNLANLLMLGVLNEDQLRNFLNLGSIRKLICQFYHFFMRKNNKNLIKQIPKR